jgi:hypothetical protein
MLLVAHAATLEDALGRSGLPPHDWQHFNSPLLSALASSLLCLDRLALQGENCMLTERQMRR